MRLVLSQDQEDLRASVGKFLQAHSPMSRVRDVVDGSADYDGGLWRRMAGELDLVGLVVPEEYGGSGAGHAERCVVLEELGRSLVPSPYLSSAVLAVDTLLALDDEAARAEWLPGIAAGEIRGTLAVAEPGRAWAGPTATAARPDGAGWRLDGHKNLVIDGATADLVLVYATAPDGPAFFAVPADADGVRSDPLTTLDPTRRLASLTFAGAAARRLASGDAAAALARVADQAAVALAAEQVGGLARALEIAVEYAKVRVQFGRVIGSYQAVKHGCADSYVDCELSTTVARHAAWVADHSPAELPLAAAAARAVVSPAFFRVAARTIQVLGGIGYTWEHDAHLYYRRAKSSELLFGDPQSQRAALQRLLDI